VSSHGDLARCNPDDKPPRASPGLALFRPGERRHLAWFKSWAGSGFGPTTRTDRAERSRERIKRIGPSPDSEPELPSPTGVLPPARQGRAVGAKGRVAGESMPSGYESPERRYANAKAKGRVGLAS
jgi:hypothetical protein